MNFDTFLHDAACDVTHFAHPHTYEVIEQCATDVCTTHDMIGDPLTISDLQAWSQTSAKVH